MIESVVQRAVNALSECFAVGSGAMDVRQSLSGVETQAVGASLVPACGAPPGNATLRGGRFALGFAVDNSVRSAAAGVGAPNAHSASVAMSGSECQWVGAA